jgi:PleD family two-component response regulator
MADVLIIDDSCAPAELIQDLLAQIGYAAVTCENVHQALAMVEQYRPHLMLINQTVADDRNTRYLLDRVRQIDPTSVCVAIPPSNQSASEIQPPTTTLDDYLAEFRVYRVVHPLGPARMAENINAL